MNEYLHIAATAWIVGELTTGLFHWWEDRYLTADSWLLGNLVGAPNVEHHRFPTKMCESSYWVRNQTTIIPAFVGAVVAYWLGSAGFCLGFLWASQANEIHAWAHMPQRVSWPVRALQEAGIFQSPRVHGAHHRRPYLSNYCVLTDWMNPILDSIDFWRRLERIITLATGIRPVKHRETA
jgi:hypothetical protein